jgi:hypothetical protein
MIQRLVRALFPRFFPKSGGPFEGAEYFETKPNGFAKPEVFMIDGMYGRVWVRRRNPDGEHSPWGWEPPVRYERFKQISREEAFRAPEGWVPDGKNLLDYPVETVLNEKFIR